MIAKVSNNGEILLPPELIRQDNLEAGQEFDIVRLDSGQYRLARRGKTSGLGKFSLVNWLLSCPVKDYFVPIPSESTDDL